MTDVTIGTGNKIPPLERSFRISFWSISLPPNQDIFIEFGWYVGNGCPQGVE